MPHHQTLTAAQCADELRALHIREATHMANLIDSAVRLRKHRNQPLDFAGFRETQEVNGRGYTAAQSRAGGENAGRKANQSALKRAFPAFSRSLLGTSFAPFIDTVAEILTEFGLNVVEYHVPAPPPPTREEIRQEEALIWRLYLTGGNAAVWANTDPA